MHFKVSLLLVSCVGFQCFSETSGYKILGVFPFFYPSHYFLGNELLKGLAEAGHDVTMLSVFQDKSPPNNGKYKQIIMEDLIESQKDLVSQMLNISSFTNQSFYQNPVLNVFKFHAMGTTLTEKVLNATKMQQLIKSKEKFDVVIVSQFSIEAIKAIAPHLGAHLVLLNNHAANSWMNHFVGNPNLPSINPNIFSGHSGQMSFSERLLNTVESITSFALTNTFAYPSQNSAVQKYISKDLDLTAIQYNVSLVLINSHSSLSSAASSVPCLKEIGGFHIRPPKKLPQDLQKHLDDAKNGVIYFSMGSNLKMADLPLETRSTLMKAFSKRKENVLWKFESDIMPGKPDNVKIEKWLPQSDILAHPNVKLFITHGGFLSTIETVYHGVPIVAIPIFGDQMMNAKTACHDGYAVVLEFQKLNEENLSSAIEEVLSNKKYSENVKYRSKIFHDRQVKPMDEAIYWIEYIVRHNGAKHLRVNYLNLLWYQYYLLDVFGVIFSAILLAIYILKKILCGILSICTRKSDKSEGKPKKMKKQ